MKIICVTEFDTSKIIINSNTFLIHDGLSKPIKLEEMSKTCMCVTPHDEYVDLRKVDMEVSESLDVKDIRNLEEGRYNLDNYDIVISGEFKPTKGVI